MLANGIAGSGDEWELGRLDELALLRYRSVSADPRAPSASQKRAEHAIGEKRLHFDKKKKSDRMDSYGLRVQFISF